MIFHCQTAYSIGMFFVEEQTAKLMELNQYCINYLFVQKERKRTREKERENESKGHRK